VRQALQEQMSSAVVQYAWSEMAGGANHSRQVSMTYPNGRILRYEYSSGLDDSISRLSLLADDSGGSVGTHLEQYSYLGAGTIVQVEHPAVQGGLTLSYDPDGDHSYGGWDRFGRIIDQEWTDGAGTTTLDEFTYTYDRSSNRLTRTNALNEDFSEAYTYDGLDRLIDTNRDAADFQSWNLDQLGNWAGFTDQGSTQTRTHNAANEIGTISGQLDWIDPAYDSAGNMISGPKAGDEDTRLHFVYDAWNRMTEVRADDGGEPGDPVAAYEYDGANRRIEKTVGSGESAVTTDFLYNEQWQIVEVRQNDDADPLDQYVWDVRYIDAPVVRFHDGNTDGDYADAGDNTLYATNDANMNVTALVDGDSGSEVERYVYTPYGQRTILDANWALDSDNISDIGMELGHQGLMHDGESGLVYNRARYLHTSLGVFTGRDPMRYVDGMTAYAYARSAPVSTTDPDGQWGRNIHWEVTEKIASDTGMVPWAARYLGYMDDKTDPPDLLWPFSTTPGELSFHFNIPHTERLSWDKSDSRYVHGEIGLELAWGIGRRPTPSDEEVVGALESLGRGLHAVQDWSAHGTWDPTYQCPLNWRMHPSGSDDIEMDFVGPEDHILRDYERDDVAPPPNAGFRKGQGKKRDQKAQQMTRDYLERFKSELDRSSKLYCKLYVWS